MPARDFNDSAEKPQPVQLVRKLFLASVQSGNTEIVAQILGSHPESANWAMPPFPFRPFEESMTALMMAAERGHIDIVRLLLKAGAERDAQESKGFSALMLAAQGGHKNVVDAMLEHSANTALRNKDGDTAATLAAKRGDADTARRINDALKIFGLSRLNEGAGHAVTSPATARWRKKPG
ncbi:MAG TPA: ankyrin repeat domain-containing protein [Patescibacteria group bacterium]|nr:ankyrin repeat domain-containing protein [Patescibacteria group bacterium]